MAATLTGFTTDTDQRRGTKNTIAGGSSPFPHGTIFVVVAYAFKRATFSDGSQGENSSATLSVLTGQKALDYIRDEGKNGYKEEDIHDLFLSTFNKVRVDVNGNVHQSSGTFIDVVKTAIGEGGDDQTILGRIVERTKLKKVQVTRDFYNIPVTWGTGSASSSTLNFNFID